MSMTIFNEKAIPLDIGKYKKSKFPKLQETYGKILMLFLLADNNTFKHTFTLFVRKQCRYSSPRCPSYTHSERTFTYASHSRNIPWDLITSTGYLNIYFYLVFVEAALLQFKLLYTYQKVCEQNPKKLLASIYWLPLSFCSTKGLLKYKEEVI